MRLVNIREDLFYGTSESELNQLDLENDCLLFVKDAKIAYASALRKSAINSSRTAIIHVNGGNFFVNRENNEKYNIFLGIAGKEAYRFGVSRAYGGGEVRIYNEEHAEGGMSGLGYFRLVFL